MKKHWIRFKPLRNLYVPAMKLTHVLYLANTLFENPYAYVVIAEVEKDDQCKKPIGFSLVCNSCA